jgi:ribosomal protein S18 acetylase RimI-like enzyme
MARIRKATAADIAALAGLNAHVQDEHVAAEPEIYRPAHVREVEARYAEVLQQRDAEVFVIELDDEPAGLVVMREVRHDGHTFIHPVRQMVVDELVVARQHRRRGLGRALMDAVATRANELGLDRVVLDVRAHNEAAIAFYRAMGYAPLSLRMARKTR